MKKFAVILSGCGFKDGSEVTESISTLLALSEAQAHVEVFAPDEDISAVNPITDRPEETPRNILSEATRITRTPVNPLKELKTSHFHGVLLPGGYGAALHLCNFATQGVACSVNPDMKRVLEEFHSESKPIGAFCISPVLVAKVLGSHHISVTIGSDEETAKAIEQMGAQHVPCPVNDFVTDREHKVITAPAYMYSDAQPFEVYTGIRKAVQEVFEMA